MNIKLEEGEMICPICKGTGNDINDIYICRKCDGIGKIDWISNAVIGNKKLSILNRIDVRKAISTIKQIAWSEDFDNIDIFNKKMKEHLESLQVSKAIVDYKVKSSWLNKCVDINIKPVNTTDNITLNFSIN
jgi:RecJ-like exonuclease